MATKIQDAIAANSEAINNLTTTIGQYVQAESTTIAGLTDQIKALASGTGNAQAIGDEVVAAIDSSTKRLNEQADALKSLTLSPAGEIVPPTSPAGDGTVSDGGPTQQSTEN